MILMKILRLAARYNKLQWIVFSYNREGIQATVIGEFLSNVNLRVMKFENDEERELIRPESDHLWKALRL